MNQRDVFSGIYVSFCLFAQSLSGYFISQMQISVYFFFILKSKKETKGKKKYFLSSLRRQDGIARDENNVFVLYFIYSQHAGILLEARFLTFKVADYKL